MIMPCRVRSVSKIVAGRKNGRDSTQFKEVVADVRRLKSNHHFRGYLSLLTAAATA